ncbi:MAG: GMP/IMP nucleotidase [Gammaproteobacteria bacterium]
MIKWENIETVMLDMDGTLLDLNFDNHFWQEFVPSRFALLNDMSLEESKGKLKPLFKSMEGKLEWYCLDYWSRVLALDIAGLKEEISGLISVLPHVTEFLEAMKNSNHRVLLVTNAHARSLGIKMEKTCLHRFFDGVISSHELGYPKEHPEFWKRLQGIEPFRKESTLLVDDSLAVLIAARDFGIRHLVTVSKPDSRQVARKISDFPAIEDFREIMPDRRFLR